MTAAARAALLAAVLALEARAAAPHPVFQPTPPRRFIAIDAPRFVAPDSVRLREDAPVLGVVVGADARCYPLRQLWYHHVVNGIVGGRRVAVTHCSMAHTSALVELPDDGTRLRVGGLLGDVLVLASDCRAGAWLQVEPSRPLPQGGGPLPLGPSPVQTTFGRWRAVHPDTGVLAPVEGFEDRYDAYDIVAGGIERRDVVPEGAEPGPATDVFGVAWNGGACAWPLALLAAGGAGRAEVGGRLVEVRWDADLDAPVAGDGWSGLATRARWGSWRGMFPATELVTRQESAATVTPSRRGMAPCAVRASP